jgi:hypothetical protein
LGAAQQRCGDADGPWYVATVATSPSISTPSPGRFLAPGLGYVKRQSAEHQAEAWNSVLADDPVLGPASGFEVGVSERDVDGLWMLIWILRDQEA